jgi:phospholipid/cholesterol/gamma-HCH transport system permease protein
MTGQGSVAASLEHSGSLVAFAARATREVPTAIRLYPSEVLRQAALLGRSNAPVILFLATMLGLLIGITASFLLGGVGLDSYVSAVPAVPMMRGTIEVVFGWVLAAKAGCGIVAELGAMRISEEIDAMEVMGVRSMTYLVSTKVAGAMIVLPFLFTASLGVHFLACRLVLVNFLGTVSSGGYSNVLFLLQGPRDLVIAVFLASLIGYLIVVVACFYGYHAQGGPVGVGRSTAGAMLVSLVIISVVAMIVTQLFYANVLNEAFGT